MGSAKTQFSIANASALDIQADGLIIPVFKKPKSESQSNESQKKTGKKIVKL